MSSIEARDQPTSLESLADRIMKELKTREGRAGDEAIKKAILCLLGASALEVDDKERPGVRRHIDFFGSRLLQTGSLERLTLVDYLLRRFFEEDLDLSELVGQIIDETITIKRKLNPDRVRKVEEKKEQTLVEFLNEKGDDWLERDTPDEKALIMIINDFLREVKRARDLGILTPPKRADAVDLFLREWHKRDPSNVVVASIVNSTSEEFSLFMERITEEI